MQLGQRACMCVCVVSVIVKRPVLPPSVVDGRSRNPLYYYYYYYYYDSVVQKARLLSMSVYRRQFCT